jgi:hypothetical protein
MDQPEHPLAAIFGGHTCGYVDREFDPNLIAAVDKLGEQFGPLGVAMAAATRTEPDNLMGAMREAFSHQRSLWAWLDCDRYFAQQRADESGWFVIDGNSSRPIATIDHSPDRDAEDAAHALAEHMNRKIILAKVAQATLDTSSAAKP